MIVLSFETKESPKKMLDKAVKYFVGGVGLEVTKQDDCCVHFSDENQLGYVRVTVAQKNEKYEVDIESREYDYHARAQTGTILYNL